MNRAIWIFWQVLVCLGLLFGLLLLSGYGYMPGR